MIDWANEDFDVFHVPVEAIPEGFAVEWNTIGAPNPDGWQPCAVKDFPSLVPPGYVGPHVERHGMVLIMAPKGLKQFAHTQAILQSRQNYARFVRMSEDKEEGFPPAAPRFWAIPLFRPSKTPPFVLRLWLGRLLFWRHELDRIFYKCPPLSIEDAAKMSDHHPADYADICKMVLSKARGRTDKAGIIRIKILSEALKNYWARKTP